MGLFNSNAPRRELSRRDQAVRGLIAIVVTSVILGLLFLNAKGTFSGAPRVTATLDNVGASIYPGADVKVQGVIVGKVSKLDARENGATLELTLQGRQLPGIPKNVVARVLPATVFGTSFVDLAIHGQPVSTRLRSGEVIPQDKTQETIEFQQALDDIDSLVKALGPADLNTALSAIAQALDGRGAQLGKSIDLANSMLGRYQTEWPTFRQDISLLATNMEIVSRNAPDLLDAISDGLFVAHTIVQQQGQLTALLTGGLALANDAEKFIDLRGKPLVQAIRQTHVVVDATYDNRQAGIVGAFDGNTYASNRIPGAIHDHKLWIKGGVDPTPRSYYTAADCPTYGSLRGNC
jgi:virulence factor Mce-like protein